MKTMPLPIFVNRPNGNRLKKMQYFSNTPSFRYVDLFSGAGGLSLGFQNAGFQNVFSIDNTESFCDTYRTNFPNHELLTKDITQLSSNEMKGLIGNQKVHVVAGGPPCQGFSMAGNIGRKFTDDPRNHLFKEFVRVVGVLQPNYFVMENVARLYTHNKGKTREEIISCFERLGYQVSCSVVNAADFGVPQMRRRVLFMGTKSKFPIDVPSNLLAKYKTVIESIGDLPPLRSGEISKVLNHTAMKHSLQMLKKMSHVKDGGGRDQIPSSIRPQSGDVRKYIRYKSDAPAVCVTGDMRKIFHYSQNRALTVRELARLQSFPDSFLFRGSSISQQQQVGNAVPPLLAFQIAKHIKEHAEKYG